jgi:1,4-dihydroxy-2-naphthoate octaprenyltransferase
METVKINVKVDFMRFLNLRYQLFYRHPVGILINLCALILIGLSMLYFTGNYRYSVTGISLGELFAGIFFLAFYPVQIYYTTKKSFHNKARFTEQIQFEFSQTEMKISGESFKSEMTLGKLQKIRELKDWILIYPNAVSAYFIPKENIMPDQLNCLRVWFSGLKSVKVKML